MVLAGVVMGMVMVLAVEGNALVVKEGAMGVEVIVHIAVYSFVLGNKRVAVGTYLMLVDY